MAEERKDRRSVEQRLSDTTREATAIMDAEAKARNAKTARLKEQRLAKEQADREAAPAAPVKRIRKASPRTSRPTRS